MRKISRRGFIATTASAGTVIFAPNIKAARAAGELRVLDSGGVWQTAAKRAWYEPFEKETGVKVIAVSGLTASAAQLIQLAQSGRREIDVAALGINSLILCGMKGSVEPLDYNVIKPVNFMPDSKHEFGLGMVRAAEVLVFNKNTYKAGATPKRPADFWNTKGFPGRRCLGYVPTGMLEHALVADGVPKHQVYPIDIDRALKKLDQIKSQTLWWTAYAQVTQLLVDKEVDLILANNARSQAAIDAGAPYEIIWDDLLLSLEGWGVPKGADKKLAMEFIQFTTDPKRQAVYCEQMAFGPTNLDTFKYLPESRAKILPTYPTYLKNAYIRNEQYYAENQPEVWKKWEEWRAKK